MSTIATLLEAEKEASKIVQQARQYRTERLKAARVEAQKEIEDLRKQKQAEFESYSNTAQGDAAFGQKLEKETEVEIKKLNNQFEQNKSKSVDRLLQVVTDAQVKMHPNTDIFLKFVK
eukprot:NODE_22_length_42145_cov_1.310612.p32 type:complete len:118 gc:universal NODE_22_length_42145_cov_1.310612:36968-37321(+)